MTSNWLFSHNEVWGNLTFGSLNPHKLSDENQGTLTAYNNTFLLDGKDDLPAITIPRGNSGKDSLLNNIVISLSSEPDNPVIGIKELETGGDISLLRNNAFIGFDAPDHIMMMNEGSNPLNNVAMLNMLSDLSECARGGNIEIPTMEEAHFMSIDPDDDHFLRLTADSPLIGAGLTLPYTCDDVEYLSAETDLYGNPIPCAGDFDIGAYQFCPEE